MRKVFAFFILLLPLASPAQDNYTDAEVLFDDSELLTIEVTMNPDSFAWLFQEENLESDRYLMASVRLLSSNIDTTIDTIGFRLRGNTSRNADKKSFKISFEEFGVEEDRVFGLKKMNLKGEQNDPCVIRSKLNWDLFEKMNVPGSRCAHCRLYVNGEYRGLYIHVEEYDKTFLRTRFGDDSGNFFKCLWPADLGYISSNPNDYKFVNGDRRAYELHTNEDADDYTDLAQFINLLNNAPQTIFEATIEENLNVWSFLKALSVEVLTGHWDNYWFNKNNFWLYHDGLTGRFEYIPYDVDNTYGIWWEFEGGHDWGTDNIYDWGNVYNEPRPLVDRLLEIPQYRNLYTYFIEALIDEAFNDDYLFARINTLLPILSPAAETDSYRTLDYGWSYQDFLDSYNSALGGHVYYGLRPYIITRENSARMQLEQDGMIAPVFISQPQAILSQDPIHLEVQADIFDDSGQPQAVTFHRVVGDQEVSLPMEFEEFRYDGIIQYSYYTGTFEFTNPEVPIYYYLRAEDTQGNVTLYPKGAPDDLLSIGGYQLLINELQASNDTTVSDEAGEFDDWLELYNNSDSTISIGEYSLSDDPAEPEKWLLPDVSIGAYGFLLLWIDDDENQGELHGSFNLNRDGEFIGLFHRDGASFSPVDTFTFGYQETDRSLARIPDGSPNWQEASPTPGSTNVPTGVTEEMEPGIPQEHALMNIYPNPFNPTTTIALTLPAAQSITLEVFNVIGQSVYRYNVGRVEAGVYYHHFDGAKLPSGVYMVVANTGQECLKQKMLLIR